MRSEDWLPISSAPKDGTRILLYRQGYAEPMCVAWWSYSWRGWSAAIGGITVHGATHWQPIEAPASEGDTK